jgi:hypothetical protein
MQELSPQGEQIIEELGRRHGVSTDAVKTMLRALINGNGTMAQFNHPEFGGSGQWMKGGMTMVGDMFNNGLKAKVDALCSELANLLNSQTLLVRSAGGQSQRQGHQGGASLFSGQGSGQWWPSDLGIPAAAGAQNNIRYAVFPGTRRLAIESNGHITIYDTGDHLIGGVSQQQGTSTSLAFTSQHGVVAIDDLPVVAEGSAAGWRNDATDDAPSPAAPAAEAGGADDVFAKLERLADLKQKGILSEQEFADKKAQLLSKI